MVVVLFLVFVVLLLISLSFDSFALFSLISISSPFLNFFQKKKLSDGMGIGWDRVVGWDEMG